MSPRTPAEVLDLRKLPTAWDNPGYRVSEPAAPGSNNFAVSGRLTADGRAIVADDMHLGLRAPNIWFRARLQYDDAVTGSQSWADVPTCTESGLAIERYQMPRTIWLPKDVTDEQVSFYREVLSKVRDTEEWKTWLRRGSQSDVFMTGPELADYIAADERWLREQFAADGWLVR